MVQPCRRSSPKINASRTPGLLPWISALALPVSLAQRERFLPRCWWWRAALFPRRPATRARWGEKNPSVGHCPRAKAVGTAMAQEVLLQAAPDAACGDISSSPAVWDASRSCCGGQLPDWEMLGFLSRPVAWWPSRELGAPPHPGPGVLIEPAGMILPALGIPGVPGGGEREPGCLWMGSGGWDGVRWRQTCFPLNPLGTGGGKHPSPHHHGVWGGPGGCRAAFPHH